MTGTWLTLSQLNALIRGVMDEWAEERGDLLVVAEISEIRRGPTGHWYLKLVERREEGIVAALDAVIWAGAARTVEEFRKVTGTPLSQGMEVLFRGRVTFHERYGLKLEIRAIDPTYSLGEMQRQRREVIARLTREGLMDRNKRLPFPLVPQRIGIVASLESAGYQDFVDQLRKNPYGYGFLHQAFPAVMQGDGAESSVSDALARVGAEYRRYDVVVLIRGGGSQVDLSCFDTYGVGAAIAKCPLPVITGIGHERDETVADMAAHTRAKTPTAAAEVIVAAMRKYEERIEDCAARMAVSARSMLGPLLPELADLRARLTAGARRSSIEERDRLSNAVAALAAKTLADLRSHSNLLEVLLRRLWQGSSGSLAAASSGLEGAAVRFRLGARSAQESLSARLEAYSRDLRHLDPQQVLARGFSITRYGGQAVRHATQVPVAAVLETTLAHGKIWSLVQNKEDPCEEGRLDIRKGDGTAGGDSA